MISTSESISPLRIRVGEVAKLLGVSTSTVWSCVRRGEPGFPRPRKLGRSTFWVAAEVVAYANR